MHNNQYVVHTRIGACIQDCKSLLIMHPLVASPLLLTNSAGKAVGFACLPRCRKPA